MAIDWDDMNETARLMEEGRLAYEKKCDEYWNSLSYDDKLMAFYSVMKRIHKGELEDRGSYRWVLYDIFGFGPDSYIIGMDCGYMELHNAIMPEVYDK